MISILAILHIIFCITLIALILLQDPKGGAAGGVFGGSGGSNTLLGATGATTFLAKLTRGTAIAFGILCLIMTWYLRRDTGSVIDSYESPAGAKQTAPAQPVVPAGAAAPVENPGPKEKAEDLKGMKEAAPATQPEKAPSAPEAKK